MDTLPNSNKQVLKTVWRLGMPVAVQSLLASSLGFIDTLMVSALGPSALAGVGLVGRLMFVMAMVLSGVAGGAGILIAQYAGARKDGDIRSIITAALYVGLTLTAPCMALFLFAAPDVAHWLTPDTDVAQVASTFLLFSAGYAPLTAVSMTLSASLRSLGNTRTPMWAAAAGILVNTVLNYLFITGRFGLPGYGVAAAAVATTLARIVEIVIVWIAMRGRFGGSVSRVQLLLLSRTTLPLAVKEVCWAGGIFAAAFIVGRMGKLPLAALNLVTPVEAILVSVFVGCGVATGVLLGQALGREAYGEAFVAAQRLRRLIPRLGLAVGLTAAALVQLARHNGWLTGLIDAELHNMALDTLTVMLVMMGARIHNMMVSLGILRSGNDVTWLMMVDMCSMWLVNVPLVALAALVLHLPLPAVVGVMMLEEVLKVAVFRWRVRSGRWLNSVTAERRPASLPS